MSIEIDKLVRDMFKREMLRFDMDEETVRKNCTNYLVMLQLNNETSTKVDEMINVYRLLKSHNDFINTKKKVINSLSDLDGITLSENIDLYRLPSNYILSESFMTEYSDSLNWNRVSESQILSEDFIEKHVDRVDWREISLNQKLSEDFIWKFKDKVYWRFIVKSQNLSDRFLDKISKEEIVRWSIFYADGLFSENIITSEECNDLDANGKLTKLVLKYYEKHHKQKSYNDRKLDMKEYAEKYGLRFDGEYLYAYREHDEYGRGSHSIHNFYEVGKYYRDWHCDMDNYNDISFGLGIYNQGNVRVKVSVNDWGLWLRYDGKCRVWGFTLLSEN